MQEVYPTEEKCYLDQDQRIRKRSVLGLVRVMLIFIRVAGGVIKTACETVQVKDAPAKYNSRKGREEGLQMNSSSLEPSSGQAQPPRRGAELSLHAHMTPAEGQGGVGVE